MTQPDLYPLLLIPEFRNRVWGTHDLSPIYDKEIHQDPVGEVWVAADSCRVATGVLSGTTLSELCERFGEDLFGSGMRDTSRFPLLIKFLFPRQKLSVQVHPDDALAESLGQPCGKTECWYVLDANPGANIGLGLKSGVGRDQLVRAIRENRMEACMN